MGQCWGHAALSSSISPLSPHFLLEGGRAAPKAFGSVPEPPGKGQLLWGWSLTPTPAPLAALLLFRPISSACGTCSMPTKSLFSLQSLRCQHRQCRGSELPPDPISSQSPPPPLLVTPAGQRLRFSPDPGHGCHKELQGWQQTADSERQRLLSPETRGKLLHLQRFPRPCPLPCTSIWSDTFLQAPFISFPLTQTFALR